MVLKTPWQFIKSATKLCVLLRKAPRVTVWPTLTKSTIGSILNTALAWTIFKYQFNVSCCVSHASLQMSTNKARPSSWFEVNQPLFFPQRKMLQSSADINNMFPNIRYLLFIIQNQNCSTKVCGWQKIQWLAQSGPRAEDWEPLVQVKYNTKFASRNNFIPLQDRGITASNTAVP